MALVEGVGVCLSELSVQTPDMACQARQDQLQERQAHLSIPVLTVLVGCTLKVQLPLDHSLVPFCLPFTPSLCKALTPIFVQLAVLTLALVFSTLPQGPPPPLVEIPPLSCFHELTPFALFISIT